MAVLERVYRSHDNLVVLTVEYDDTATPLQGVTRITCALSPAGVTVDSAVDSTAVFWTPGGQITLDFGDVAAYGQQRAELVAYDPVHPVGQVLTHPLGPTEQQLTLEFVE